MSMKLNALALAAMAGMMSASGYGLPRRDYSHVKRSKKEYKPYNFNLPVPKGHQVDTMDLVIPKGEYTYSCNLYFSYGTPKSKFKRYNKLKQEITNYILNTPHEKLVEFDQFTIEKLRIPEE